VLAACATEFDYSNISQANEIAGVNRGVNGDGRWASCPKIAAPALVVFQPRRGDRLAPRRVHQVRGEPVILQQLHQPAGAAGGLERGRVPGGKPPITFRIGSAPLGTFRFARTCPSWSITATCERLRCTSIPT